MAWKCPICNLINHDWNARCPLCMNRGILTKGLGPPVDEFEKIMKKLENGFSKETKDKDNST